MTKFAFFDFDKTLYDGFSTIDFYLLMAENGWWDKAVYQEDQKLRDDFLIKHYSYDEISLKVIELGIRLLKGFSRQQILEMEDQFSQMSLKFYPYVYPLIHRLNQEGFISYIISAATFPPVEAVGRELKMPFFASTAKMTGHTYTGELKLFLNGEAKRQKIQEILKDAAQPTFSLGFGDSTGDLPLLETTNQGFVINPHQEEMKEMAKQRGYILTDADHIVSEVEKALKP